MATSGSVGGSGHEGGLPWSSASAPYQSAPASDPGVVSNFNVVDGCPKASNSGARSRMITQWSAALLAANGLDPDDMSRVVVTNAQLNYKINGTGTASNRTMVVAGYGQRGSCAAESWNDAVAEGLDGDASPFTAAWASSASPAIRELSGAGLNAVIQAQLRSNGADGIISLIHYWQGDTGFNDLAIILGGSSATAPWPGDDNVSLSFDWELEAAGPVLDMADDPKVYRSGSGASAIDPTLTVTSTPDILTAEIQIQAGEEGDSIAFGALPAGILADEAGGIITLTGPASAADFQTALRAMTFQSTAVPSDTLRIIRFFLTDVDEGTSGAVDFNVLVHSSTVAEARVPQGAVTNINALAGFFKAAASRPVDVGLICDSNGVQVTYSGHTQGLTYAWAQAFPCWGAGIAPATAESNGWASPVGDVSVGDAHGEGEMPGADASLETPAGFQAGLWSPEVDGTGPDSWDYFKPGSPGGVIWDGADADMDCVLNIRSRHPIFMGSGLIYQARVYIPAADACTHIFPCVVGGIGTGAAAVIYPNAPTPISLPAAEGFSTLTWHVPAGAIVADGEFAGDDGSGIQVRLCHYTNDAGDSVISGEFGLTFQAAIDPSKDRGVRVSRLMVAGGQPTGFVAGELISRSDEGIAEWLRFMADNQRAAARNPSLQPVCLLHILEGINDSIDDDSGSTIYPRGGPAAASPETHGNTVQGFINNTTAIINRLRDIWVTTCGFSEGNLYFLLGGSHPMPSGVQLTMLSETMPEAIADICADPDYSGKVAGMDGYKIRVPDHLQAVYGTQRDATEYDHASDGSDPAHMNERGYIDYDARLVGALMAAAIAAGLVSVGGSGGSRRSISSGS